MKAVFQGIDRNPVRAAIVLTTILAVIELTVLTVPLPADSTFGVALLLPIVGALVGGLPVRSWWWPLIYVIGCLVGMAVWLGFGMRDGDVLDAGRVVGGVIAASAFILPPVIICALIGPLISSIHRRIGLRRTPLAEPAPDRGTV